MFTLTPSQPKTSGHRICTPDKTLERIRPHFEDVGITRLADITGLDRIGIPVIQAVRPLGRSLSVSQGKGMNIAAAKASAAMESIEVWHAEFFELDRSMIGTPATKPLDLAHYGIDDPEGLVNTLTWTHSTNLMSGEDLCVPIDLVHMDFVRQAETDCLPRTSNGLAAGNSWNEAIASALHELIERDAMADWYRAYPDQQAGRRVAPAQLSDRYVDVGDLLALIADAGVEIDIYDATNDLGVPTAIARIYDVIAMSHASDGPPTRPSIGSGSHLDPQTALVRAITEAAQSRLTMIAGSRDDLNPWRYERESAGNVDRLAERLLDLARPKSSGFDHADQSGKTAAQDAERLLGILRTHGLDQVAAVDLTKDAIGIPVVRVIAPQLGRQWGNAILTRPPHFRSEGALI